MPGLSSAPAEKPRRDTPATEDLRKLRAYLAGKSENIEKLNAEQDETLDEINRKRLDTAEEAIERRRVLSLELAA